MAVVLVSANDGNINKGVSEAKYESLDLCYMRLTLLIIKWSLVKAALVISEADWHELTVTPSNDCTCPH